MRLKPQTLNPKPKTLNPEPGELGIAMKREVEAGEHAGKEQRLKILKRLVALSEKHLRNTVNDQ